MVKRAKNVDPAAVAQKQAANVMKQMQSKNISSVGTVRNYEQRLAIVARHVNDTFQCGLRDLTVKQAYEYLNDRAIEVGQKTLDMERQAIQSMMQNVTKKLESDETLNVVKSEHKQILESRAYTREQVKMIASAQNERNALSTEIAHSAGLRAHELFTIKRIEERDPDERPARNEKFSGRDGERYTVRGKGGLIREICIPKDLAERLEKQRLEQGKNIKDRGVNYTTFYDVAGGKNWSNSFSAASKRELNWNAGGHGLRHSYAQERMHELQTRMNYDVAREVVSQELGHFRKEITDVYLR